MTQKYPSKRILTIILITAIALASLAAILPDNSVGAAPQEVGTISPELAEEEDSNILLIIQVVIGLLLISSLVGIVTERLRVPYTAGLVVIGLFLALIGQQEINVSPELILGLLVPPLIFEAAFQVKIQDLFKDIVPILSLAIPGVLITMFLVGGVLYWGTDFSLTSALLFGSLIAATDPVAVVALFRSLGVPHRLQLLLEGESLFNDGTVIVVFNIMLTISVTGAFSLSASVIGFFVVAGGGLGIGILLGLIISQAISRIDNSLIETTLTTVLAFGSYIVAEQFHVSGVLAVVAAGIVSGNLGPQRMAPTSRILVFSFWEYAAFLANSFVFLLIGLQIDLNILLTDWSAILWAILAVLLARAVSIYGLSWIGPGIPNRYKHVLYWGGLRGAISLALALSLPSSLGEQGTIIQSMAFGVVLFTLLVQGLTMKPFISRMGLIEINPAQEEYERLNARTVMARAANQQIDSLYRNGVITRHVWDLLSQPIEKHTNKLVEASARTMRLNPDLENKELQSAINSALTSEKAALRSLLRDGKISDEVFTELSNEVNAALTEDQIDLVQLLKSRSISGIDTLMTIVIQEKDLGKVSNILETYGYPMVHIASTGGFLGRRNATVLVGMPANRSQEIQDALETASLANPNILIADYASDEYEHDGATFFSLHVERYEVL